MSILVSRLQVKFMPMAPVRRRKTEPVSGAVGVVEDADLKHVVHVVRHRLRRRALSRGLYPHLDWRRDWPAGCRAFAAEPNPHAARQLLPPWRAYPWSCAA